MKAFIALLAVLSFSLPLESQAGTSTAKVNPPAAAPKKTVRLLAIGNSFSGNATRYLGDIAKADGNKLILRPLAMAGASLQQHADKLAAYELDTKDKKGLYISGRSLRQHLEDGPWDFVTLQQASIKSHDVDSYRPFAATLHSYIKQYAPGAEILMHETWAYRKDDARFNKVPTKPGEPTSQADMYEKLSSAYATVAKELGIRIIPSGDAFYLADTDPKQGYQPDILFDFKASQSPALPDQRHSLHIGWRWQKGKDGKLALNMDGHHASTAGEYLGACVWYEVLFNENVIDNTFLPPKLDPAYAAYLRKTAHKAVARLNQPKDQ